MYDGEIRSELKSMFVDKIFVDEIKVGRARVDLLDLSNELHGFEIKSNHDSYSRLKNQSRNYNKFLSKTTIVIGPNKVDTIELVIPAHWGIMVMEREKSGKITLKEIRTAKTNPYFKKKYAIGMLWRQEMIKAICDIYESKPKARYEKMRKWTLADILQKELAPAETVQLIRKVLLARLATGTWRD